MKAEIEEERAVMRRKAGAGANDMLHHLEGDDDDYDYSDEDSFSEDDYYYQPPEKRVESCVTVKVEDLRKSITSSQDLSRSVEGRASGSEVDQLLADRPGCMQISDTCIRVPVYARRSSGTDAPVLVLQFELPFKYPAVAPAILVVTAGDYVTETMRAYLVDWLLVQAASKLGRPMISGLLGLATMWAEIQQEAEDKRKQSEAEERRKQEAKEALEKEVEVKERALAAAADEAARARREAGEEEPEGPEVEEESSQDSADKERRARPTTKFAVRNGVIPKLKYLCIKCFGDNLLMFEGFEEVPIQIRSKVFSYLLESRSLSHRKLALLVAEDQKNLNLGKSAYVRDHYMDVLAKATNLTQLSLAKCTQLTDIGFAKVALCGKLTDLNLSRTQISSFAFHQIVSSCPNLVKVNVSGCPLLTTGLSALTSRCDKLTYLFANDCPSLLPDDALKALNLSGPLLHTFEFSGCGSNLMKTASSSVNFFNRYNVAPRAFSLDYRPLTRPLPSLTVLKLARNFFITDNLAVNFFHSSMPNLQVLDFENSPLTGKGVLHIWTMAPGLTKFGISKWSKNDEAVAEEIKFFHSFLVAAAGASKLLELDLSGGGRLSVGDIMPLFGIGSLERLNLSKLSEGATVETLLPLLNVMKSLRILRLRYLSLGTVKMPDARSFDRLQTVQLWDLVGLTDAHVGALAKSFQNVRAFSLRGKCAVTREGVLTLLNTCNNMATLTIDADTGIFAPLSVFSDLYHTAPVEELILPHYRLSELFVEGSLGDFTDKRNVDTKLRVLLVDSGEKTGRWKFGSAVMDGIIRTACMVFPFLEVFDLSHQFAQLHTIVDFPPRLALRSVITCPRHDTAKLNMLPPSCVVRLVDCTPEVALAHQQKFGPAKGLYESSDSSFDYALFDLFD